MAKQESTLPHGAWVHCSRVRGDGQDRSGFKQYAATPGRVHHSAVPWQLAESDAAVDVR